MFLFALLFNLFLFFNFIILIVQKLSNIIVFMTNLKERDIYIIIILKYNSIQDYLKVAEKFNSLK